jgi:hypothetical protein
MKFIHRFSRSLSCEMTVRDEAPAPGQSHVKSIEWIGQPKPKHVAEYRQWVLHTTSILAERWNVSILYGLGVGPKCTEFWQFEPGKAPKLLATAPVGIP